MSSYRTETQQLSAQFVNSSFVRKLDEGRTKEAAAEGTAFIRELVRQESYAREGSLPSSCRMTRSTATSTPTSPRRSSRRSPTLRPPS